MLATRSTAEAWFGMSVVLCVCLGARSIMATLSFISATSPITVLPGFWRIGVLVAGCSLTVCLSLSVSISPVFEA